MKMAVPYRFVTNTNGRSIMYMRAISAPVWTTSVIAPRVSADQFSVLAHSGRDSANEPHARIVSRKTPTYRRVH